MDKTALILRYAELFSEAVDFGRLTKKFSLPLVINQNGNETSIIVVQDTETELKVRAGATLGPNLAQMAPGHSVADWPYRVATIWSDSNMIGAYLFGALLAGSKRLVSDTSVTPAAQLVIKNYWNKYKDDPSYVTPEVLAEAQWNLNAPWLRAGYHGDPIGGAYNDAFRAGYEITQQIPVEKIVRYNNQLWNYYYENEKKIKFDPKTLRETGWLNQQGVINQEEILAKLERGDEITEDDLVYAENTQ